MNENKHVNLDTMPFKHLLMWTVNSLKKHLHICGKLTEGDINDLVAR